MILDVTRRLPERPHYTQEELDEISEYAVTSYLTEKHGNALFPICTDDLASLIEVHAEDLDLYADLSQLGSDVEGVTLFNPDGKPSIRIAARLSEAKRENRLRTTLAHELGHALLHNILFERCTGPGLFDDEEVQTDRVQACREGNMLNAGQSDWMEWQAGYVSGAILMPATQVRLVIAHRFPNYIRGGLAACGDLFEAMVGEVQSAFQVSSEAARIRLLKLQVVRDAGLTSTLF
ncbi:ImmA/IrrE family metallo-endopeptidase [Variovorax sp. MHTC-1]|uniref:ImmA/IrrE family metallo-endopeptidase n=1 Tax=Variovorax sp. MHTC-1 TaxID=2495593 RepID=UPI000F89392B|nr:ImmA/IrrE family metallo-endopeptidase [Variovorax sp. MHTC-1]RST51283.1 ImmA/IrrE family metallo-endopeptidase [Variovorax sp. MHTC-1]